MKWKTGKQGAVLALMGTGLLFFLFTLLAIRPKPSLSTTSHPTPVRVRATSTSSVGEQAEARQPLPSPTVMKTPDPAGPPNWLGIWQLPKKRMLLALYHGPEDPSGKRWQEVARWLLPKEVQHVQSLGFTPDGTLWLLVEEKGKTSLFRWKVDTGERARYAYLAWEQGMPVAVMWLSQGPQILVEVPQETRQGPCWAIWSLPARTLSSPFCAEELRPSKSLHWPLGWLNEHTVYGLRMEVEIGTPTAAGGPNVAATGQWALLLLDVHTQRLEEVPLPPMPQGYRHRPFLNVIVKPKPSYGDASPSLWAAISHAGDAACPTFGVLIQWDPALGQGSPRQTRCFPFPALRLAPLAGEVYLWLRGTSDAPGQGELWLQTPQGSYGFSLPHEDLIWAPWTGMYTPRLWKQGVLAAAQKLQGAEPAWTALYWLPLPGSETEVQVLASPPSPQTSNGRTPRLVALFPLEGK